MINFVKDNQNDIVLITGVILIALISFGAGRLTCHNLNNHQEMSITNQDKLQTSQNPENQSMAIEIPKTQIIGNKNSKIYHYPWCSGAKNMKEENKVFFSSIEEAQKAGYRPAGNCPGL